MKLRVAAAAWQLRPAKGDSDYFGHFHDLVSAAHDEGAQVVVLPELHCLELLPLVPDLDEQDAAKFLLQYGQAIEDWIARISRSSGLIIVGGSHFRGTEDEIKNVCAIGVPDHGVVIAEKNNVTAYETEVWDIKQGSGLPRLPSHLGVNLCYDAEFPEAARKLAEDGMRVLCVPSFTESQYGFQRVRWSCLARAIENQIFVVHAALVGSIGYEPAATTFGTSAILAPSIEPFPIQAILRETPPHEEGIVVADLDVDMLDEAREHGLVRNWHDRNATTWEITGEPFPPMPEEPPASNALGDLN